jgi:L-fuculose-phosphate aldolase
VADATVDAGAMKAELLWAAQEMARSGLVQGTAGNLGARLPDGNVVLTPSSLDYEDMTIDDLVVCNLDGDVVEGSLSPTTEKALHLTALRVNDDINATIHCHAKFATMFAITRTTIPAVVEEFDVYVGGDVEVAEYQMTGSQDLADEIAGRVATKGAVLMANHGLFAVGRDPKHALHVAQLVERTAEIVWGARRLGEIVPLPDEVNETFAGLYRHGRTVRP